jgi:uncharacterized Ntn-hydrolase superfamily protein
MTFSIVYFDDNTGACGVATATGSVAVGAFVPHVEAGVGALTTQGAYTNWLYGKIGLDRMRKGEDSESVLQYLINEDTGREYRQCLIIGRDGSGAGWTGSENRQHREIVKTDGVIAGGNLLAEKGVAAAMIDSFQSHPENSIARRLLDALRQGERAGGDARGLVSAAIKVDFLDKPPIDIRVDYAPEATLEKLFEVYQHYHNSPFKEFYAGVPTRTDFSKCGSTS